MTTQSQLSPPQPSGNRPWPTVSAVVATRDRLELLRRAIHSILSQDYPGDIQCVVVFDQSEPIPELEVNDSHRGVHVIRNNRSPGLAGGRNSGILAADGEFVAFCDDDDVWLPSKLRTQMEAVLSDPTATFVTCGIRVRYGDRVVQRALAAQRIEFRDLLRSRLTELHPSTFLMRRSALIDGFGLVDEEIMGSYGEDYEFLLRAAREAPIRNVPDIGVEVLWHQRSYFSSRWATIAAALRWLLDRYPEFRSEPRGAARVAGQIAFATAAQGQRTEALRWAAKTLRWNPREPRAYLALAVASSAVSADAVLRRLHRYGRGL